MRWPPQAERGFPAVYHSRGELGQNRVGNCLNRISDKSPLTSRLRRVDFTLYRSMAVAKSIITDTELDLLKVLWEGSPLSAREITEQLYQEVTRLFYRHGSEAHHASGREEDVGALRRSKPPSFHSGPCSRRASPACNSTLLQTNFRKALFRLSSCTWCRRSD